MIQAVLTAPVTEKDLAAVRTRAREVGELAGLENLQQTRFATAVSEISRNTVQYAREGSVTFSVVTEPGTQAQSLVAEVTDAGPGIENLDDVLRGRATQAGGRAAMGIAGSKRLVDQLVVECPAGGGTRVRLEMLLPRGARPLAPADVSRISMELARRKSRSPHEELDRQNRELLRTLQELREKQAELEKADEMKNRFVTTLAHELRSPLATLQLSLELMRRKTDMRGDELASRHALMARQTGQMTKLVEDLMDVARVRQGKVQLSKQPFELNTLITHSVEMTGAAIAAKAHEVSLDLHEEPLWVSGDAPRLTQVMCNLIQNSARYTASGGAIDIQVRREDASGVVHVKDNGMGIAPDVLPHIFGLFVQGHDSQPHGEAGLGLGLALVHHLVRDHGGTVSAASDGLDRGSCFTLRLPLIAGPELAAA